MRSYPRFLPDIDRPQVDFLLTAKLGIARTALVERQRSHFVLAMIGAASEPLVQLGIAVLRAAETDIQDTGVWRREGPRTIPAALVQAKSPPAWYGSTRYG